MSVKYFIFLFVLDTVYSECRIDIIDDISEVSPIITQNQDGILNSDNSVIPVRNSERVFFVCPGINNVLSGYNARSIGAICQRNRFFHAGGQIDIKTLRCLRTPEFEVRHVGSCGYVAKLFHIGYKLRLGFQTKIKVCYNPERQRTAWTKHHYNARGYNWMITTPKWRNDSLNFLHDVDAEEIYHREVNLTRGRLAPLEDFHTAAAKRLTFSYLNSAPQLTKFNFINWSELESAIRSLNRRLTIYTGTQGVTRFLHESDRFPIPAYFWKVIVDETARKGVAFIGVNGDNFDRPKLCTDICHTLDWLGAFKEGRRDDANGYVYCCRISDFKNLGFKLPTINWHGRGLLQARLH